MTFKLVPEDCALWTDALGDRDNDVLVGAQKEREDSVGILCFTMLQGVDHQNKIKVFVSGVVLPEVLYMNPVVGCPNVVSVYLKALHSLYPHVPQTGIAASVNAFQDFSAQDSVLAEANAEIQDATRVEPRHLREYRGYVVNVAYGHKVALVYVPDLIVAAVRRPRSDLCAGG